MKFCAIARVCAHDENRERYRDDDVAEPLVVFTSAGVMQNRERYRDDDVAEPFSVFDFLFSKFVIFCEFFFVFYNAVVYTFKASLTKLTFSITEKEVRLHYQTEMNIKHLTKRDVKGGLKGEHSAFEQIWLITPAS